MMPKNTRLLRRTTLAGLAAGFLLQAGGCSPGSLIAVAVELATQEAANLLSDSIFFFLDNLFVRMTG